ncbi:ankyrin repeat and SAM domain-containing protein 3-like [Argiope bruennichi]|uniref:ankyrin repeat and SAM domain-containing protein 3-like n=1 Tax=Argiope bruennichi TaxID=94029 RepID=UPI0024943FDE|nr:ankyrin repeat and SAM domain-containing protein 3-like [Argiope bruennichi]
MDLKLFQELLPEESEYMLDLHTAASIGCEERVIDLIENTENKLIINQQNSCGWTPLMYASCCANLRIVGLLLEEGAFTDLKNHDGHTALILASKCGSTDAVSLLIDHGAFINDCDNKGWSALSYAAAFGHRSVVQLLIEKGAVVDHVDKKEGLTPLMLSSAAGHEMVVQDLLRLGLNPNSQSKSGETARSLAVKNGHMKVKNLVDAHLCAKRNCNPQGMKSSSHSNQTDLQKLLNEMKLSKYYYVFENHGIDIDMFWLLTEEDLKEIGIQLVGPRKKLCMVIAEWYLNNASKGNFDDRTFCYKLVLDNKKLLQRKEELESALTRESELKKAAETNLNEGIRTLKNFSDTVQRTLSYTTLLEEKLKQSYVNFKKLLYRAPDSNWLKYKADIIHPLMGEMEKLLDSIHHHTMLALQQTNFRR